MLGWVGDLEGYTKLLPRTMADQPLNCPIAINSDFCYKALFLDWKFCQSEEKPKVRRFLGLLCVSARNCEMG